MTVFSFGKEGIYEYQKNRPPYLFIDYVEEVIPGERAKGYKCLNDEWFFKCHWPEDPNMPGMLQIEALVQMSALTVLTLPGNKGKLVYLVAVEKIKLIKKIIPGDKLYIETILHSWKRGVGKCSGKGIVDSKLACKAEFTIVLPEEINKYKRELNAVKE